MTAPGRDRDTGFTLVELLIAIVLSAIIAGVTVAALATSMNVASSTSAEVADSTDAGLITAFLFRDAQAAGTTDPATATSDAAYGVVTADSAGKADAATVWSGCDQDGSLVARFSWVDRNVGLTGRPVVVTYALDGAAQLTRRICTDGTTSDVVLAHSITAATAACVPDPSCGVLATGVALTVSGSGTRAPYAYTLSASLRVDEQSRPTAKSASTVSLVALGGGVSERCPNLVLDSGGRLRVSGDVLVDGSCGADPIKGDLAPDQVTGTISANAGIGDPFATLAVPAASCGTDAKNPDPVGGVAKSGEPTVYPQPVNITGPVAFAPGVHVFCSGLDIGIGGSVTGEGVFLLVAGGALTIDASADVSLDAATTGPYANLLVWVATTQSVVLGAGERASRLAGYVYAPTSEVRVQGDGATNIGGVVAARVVISGKPAARLGLPLPRILIAPEALPVGQQAAAFSPIAFSASGGSEPVSWSAAGVPDGMQFDPAAGVLSGTPQLAGVFELTVTAFDASGAAASRRVTLTIAPPLGIDTSTVLPVGVVGDAYPASVLGTTGGTRPFVWSASGLPDGIILDPATGVLTGTPKASGSFPVVIGLRDATLSSVTAPFTIVVQPPLAIATKSLPPAQVTVAYPKSQLGATGGTGPYVWSATGLPAGMALDATGVLSGTPTTAGSNAVIVTVADSAKRSTTVTLSLTVNPPVSIGTTALPTGEVGAGYQPTTLTPAGGTAPFTWTAVGLPSGLMLDPVGGIVSGTPTAAGTSTVTVTVVDATGTSATAGYSVTVVPTLTITGPKSLPAGQARVTYTATGVATSGGISPLNWSATGLPPGLRIDAVSGVISGQPTANGTFQVVVSVADSALVLVQRSYSVVIGAPLAVATTNVPTGSIGSAYSTTLAATGGTAPYTWSATGLPAGLSISPAGVVSGKPTASGTFSVAVTVADAGGATAVADLALAISKFAPGCPADPAGWRGEYFPNRTLTGTPVLCRDDAAINFDWSSGAPDKAVPSDDFSVRWSRSQEFAAGSYIFKVGSDDGARLWIDGKVVFDRWSDQSYPSPPPTVTVDLAGGTHDVVMEYYERGGLARATLSWTKYVPVVCPNTQKVWIGEYFPNHNLTGPAVLCRVDADVDFDWATGSPDPLVPTDDFSVRWTNSQNFKQATYTFSLGSDDGGRLYIDGTLVIDAWFDQSYPSKPPTYTQKMTAGPHLIVVEYYERGGYARAQLVETVS